MCGPARSRPADPSRRRADAREGPPAPLTSPTSRPRTRRRPVSADGKRRSRPSRSTSAATRFSKATVPEGDRRRAFGPLEAARRRARWQRDRADATPVARRRHRDRNRRGDGRSPAQLRLASRDGPSDRRRPLRSRHGHGADRRPDARPRDTRLRDAARPAVGLGVGVDYALFIVSRFRDAYASGARRRSSRGRDGDEHRRPIRSRSPASPW